jgi:hypothetical protein
MQHKNENKNKNKQTKTPNHHATSLRFFQQKLVVIPRICVFTGDVMWQETYSPPTQTGVGHQ